MAKVERLIKSYKVMMNNTVVFVSPSLRPHLSRVPYWKTTRRGCQGAASGLPTHLAGETSRLIILLKRYLA